MPQKMGPEPQTPPPRYPTMVANDDNNTESDNSDSQHDNDSIDLEELTPDWIQDQPDYDGTNEVGPSHLENYIKKIQWITLERLSKKAGLTEEEVMNILHVVIAGDKVGVLDFESHTVLYDPELDHREIIAEWFDEQEQQEKGDLGDYRPDFGWR